MGWIQTFTGMRIDPRNITADQVQIEDIAHALANKCRFSGHCDPFYSVADHSMRVAALVGAPHKLYALLHDAAEAYLPDVPTPLKEYFGELEGLECRVMAAIRGKFMPNWMASGATREIVKFADLSMLAAERRDLLPHVDGWDPAVQLYIDVSGRIEPLIPSAAKRLYLEQLTAAIEAAKAGQS